MNGVGQSISEYYSVRCAGNGGITKIYNVADPPNTGPIYTQFDDVYAGGFMSHTPNVQGLPEEVAVCLSYKANNSGFNVARRRGRIYLGPLNIAAMDDVAPPTDATRVAGAFMNAIVSNAVLVQQAAAANDLEWRVWSSTEGVGYKIQSFSCDNNFDTIRGRGSEVATAHYSQPIV